MISMKTYTHAMRSDEDSLRRLVSTCQPRRGHTSVTAGRRPADRRVLHLSPSPRGSHLTLLILHFLQITRHIPLPTPCSLLIACCSEVRPLRISSLTTILPDLPHRSCWRRWMLWQTAEDDGSDSGCEKQLIFTCRPVVLHSFCFQVPTYTLFYPILPYSLSVNDCCQ